MISCEIMMMMVLMSMIMTMMMITMTTMMILMVILQMDHRSALLPSAGTGLMDNQVWKIVAKTTRIYCNQSRRNERGLINILRKVCECHYHLASE